MLLPIATYQIHFFFAAAAAHFDLPVGARHVDFEQGRHDRGGHGGGLRFWGRVLAH